EDIPDEAAQHANLGDLRPFHWELAFPEVFLNGRGGFDAFIGNPPFLGGKRISTNHGDAYHRYLRTKWSHAAGSADLSAYFFLRAYENLSNGGTLGLIATNTIAQGGTREVGLDYIHERGGVIYRAENDHPWPGSAAVAVNVVHIRRGS